MENGNSGQPIEVEVIQRLSAGLLIFAYGWLAGKILAATGIALHYYFLAIFLNIGFIFLIRQLGTSPLVRDLQEICFYDVLIAILGLVLQRLGQPDTWFWAASASVAMARLARLLWWRVDKPAASETQYAWPVFGLLGLFSRGWHRVGYTAAEKRAVYLFFVIAALLPIIRHMWAFRDDDSVVVALLVVYAVARIVPRGIAAVETAVRERDKLTRENAILEVRAEMAAQIAERNADLCHATHDCKSPVLALLNTAEALQHSTDPEVTRTTAQHLVSGLHELGDLLSEIIVMAKVTTEAVAPDADVVDMQALAWRVGELLDDEAHKRKVMLAIDDAPFCVKSNKWLLTRIITNLVTNAIVHGDRKTRVRLGIYRRGNFCYIYVWDTGRGIPNANGPDRAANFTNLLQVVHRRPNPAASYADNVLSGGHGLGLKSVMRMCNTLGITMTLISKPGWGTKFRFCVPLAGPDEKPHMIMTQDLFALAQASQSSPPKT